MENSTVNQPQSSAPAPPSEPFVNKAHNQLKLLLILIVIAAVFSSATYFFASQGYNIIPSPTVAPQPTPTDETANWKTYRNDKGKFEFRHPESWIKNSQEMCCLSIIYYEELRDSFDRTQEAESVINTKQEFLMQKRAVDSGNPPPDFAEHTKFIKALKMDGANTIQRFSYEVSGGRYVIATLIFTDTVRIDINQNLPIQIVTKPLETHPTVDQADIEKSILRLDEIANGKFDAEIQDIVKEHNLVLSTFNFLESTPSVSPARRPTPTIAQDQVVCTRDAKLCPDGSYVSRTGPNCEFAPCPSP